MFFSKSLSLLALVSALSAFAAPSPNPGPAALGISGLDGHVKRVKNHSRKISGIDGLVERDDLPIAMDLEERSDIVERGRTSGKATYFTPNVGNCGKKNKSTDLIVALSTAMYAKGKHCGHFIVVTNKKTKKTVRLKIVDSCPGCGNGDLDISPTAFDVLSNNHRNLGVLDTTWTFA